MDEEGRGRQRKSGIRGRLGRIPLLCDTVFADMAITIIAGLVFATVLTMIVLPVFYSIIETDDEVEPSA